MKESVFLNAGLLAAVMIFGGVIEGAKAETLSGGSVVNGDLDIGTASSSPKGTLDIYGSTSSSAPASLSVFGKGSVVFGDSGTSRFLWDPDFASLRSGAVVGTEWDEANTGNFSTALGYATGAKGYGQLVIGRYNILQGTLDSWTGADNVFIVGNGSSTTRANAFVIRQDGLTSIFKNGVSGAAIVLNPDVPEIKVGTSTVVTSNSSGYVGIGTTSPAGILHVGPTLNSGVDSTANNNRLVVAAKGGSVSSAGVKLGIYNPNYYFDIYNSDVSGKLGLNIDRAAGAGAVSALFISRDTGNVGVGTTAPTAKLHVVGTSVFTDDALFKEAVRVEEAPGDVSMGVFED